MSAPNKEVYFDIVAFSNDFFDVMKEKGSSYRDISKETNISIATISNLNNLNTCSLDTMAGLCIWAELNPNSYLIKK